MKTLNALVKRNVKIFFKDKGTFFTALITPIILLVLYVTFLYNVYVISFVFVGAFLISMFIKPILFERYLCIFLPLF